MVHDEWAKYVQKVEYWGGQLLWIDFAFPDGLQLHCIGIYAPLLTCELKPLTARVENILSSASAHGIQVILAGDLNGVFNPLQDCVPSHTFSIPDTVLMKALSG